MPPLGLGSRESLLLAPVGCGSHDPSSAAGSPGLSAAPRGARPSPSTENRQANDLPGGSVYRLPFFAGIKGDRFTKYIVQSYYGV